MPMAPLESRSSWLTKVRSAMSTATASARSSSAGGAPPRNRNRKQQSSTVAVGILAFEVASLMSKLLHLWRAVGDAAVARLRHETIHLHGVRKVVSDDDRWLLGLACAELVDTLRATTDSVAALAARCADPSLRDDLRDAFRELADTGRDRHRWAAPAPSWKDMDARAGKMERQVATTAALRRAMEELADAEHGLRKILVGGGHRRSLSASKISVAAEQQQLVFSKKQEVKHLKQTSLWGCTLDAAVASMARAAFTTLARIKAVFGAGHRHEQEQEQRHPHPLNRSLTLSLSLSSAVHPSGDARPAASRKSMSMEELLLLDLDLDLDHGRIAGGGFLEESSAALRPPAGTLGAAALAPRYAAVVISIERMARSPRLVERDELYGMLPASVRAQLRARLRGAVAAADPALAGQWRAALAGILEWLAPMAHATVRWQAERTLLEHRGGGGGGSGVLLLQTLQFAERDRVDAAVVELLVGLNYVCRFDREMEMTCRAHLFAVHHQHQPVMMVMMDGAGAEDTSGGAKPNGTVVSSCA